MNNKYKFDANSFGMRLCKIREFNGLTQEKAAEALDVSAKSIQNWEHGDKCELLTVLALNELLGTQSRCGKRCKTAKIQQNS